MKLFLKRLRWSFYIWWYNPMITSNGLSLWWVFRNIRQFPHAARKMYLPETNNFPKRFRKYHHQSQRK